MINLNCMRKNVHPSTVSPALHVADLLSLASNLCLLNSLSLTPSLSFSGFCFYKKMYDFKLQYSEWPFGGMDRARAYAGTQGGKFPKASGFILHFHRATTMWRKATGQTSNLKWTKEIYFVPVGAADLKGTLLSSVVFKGSQLSLTLPSLATTTTTTRKTKLAAEKKMKRTRTSVFVSFVLNSFHPEEKNFIVA